MQKIKLIAKLLPLLILFFAFAGTSFAATSIRLQTPSAQVNNSSLDLTFVAQTTTSSDINVQCYEKGPSDGAFVAIGSPITLLNPGNTNNCSFTLSQGNGSYQFKVTATAGAENAESVTSTNFNNSTPDVPTNYSKEKPDACTYKISFKTADDSGKTVKVVLYRSSDASFNLDSSHQVNSLNIGSNTDGSMTDNISPNCDTNYYYVIRAFDAYGNGSGAVGDSNTVVTTINPTTQTQGAIPVSGGAGGSVLGTEKGPQKEVLGSESAEEKKAAESEKSALGKNPISNLTNWIFTHKKISLLVFVLLGAIAYYIYRRYKK